MNQAEKFSSDCAISYRLTVLVNALKARRLTKSQKDFAMKVGIGETAFSKAKRQKRLSNEYIDRIVAVFPNVNREYLAGVQNATPFSRGDIDPDFEEYDEPPFQPEIREESEKTTNDTSGNLSAKIKALESEIEALTQQIESLKADKAFQQQIIVKLMEK